MQIALDIDSNFFPELPTLTATCRYIILPTGVQHQTYLLRSPSLCVTLRKGLTSGCHAAISFSFTAYVLSPNTLILPTSTMSPYSSLCPSPQSLLWTTVSLLFSLPLSIILHIITRLNSPNNLDMICVSLLWFSPSRTPCFLHSRAKLSTPTLPSLLPAAITTPAKILGCSPTTALLQRVRRIRKENCRDSAIPGRQIRGTSALPIPALIWLYFINLFMDWLFHWERHLSPQVSL